MDLDSSSTSISSDHVHWRPALFADGEMAGPRLSAMAIAHRDGLHIATDDGRIRLVWPYEVLAISRPLRQQPDRYVLYPTPTDRRPTPTLLIDDARLIEDLGRRFPRLREQSGDRDRLGLAALALVTLGFLGFVFTFTPINVSKLTAEAVPDQVWERVGNNLRERMVEQMGRRCNAPRGAAALAQMTGKLTAGLDDGGRFDVWVVDWPVVNAFALPGRRIIATRGLLTAARAPSHVAGVLAHEIGHGLLRHPESHLMRTFWSSLLVQIVSGGSGGENLLNAGASLLHLRYSRDAEREADARALPILRAAAVPAAALTGVLELAAADEVLRASSAAAGGLLSTHPSTRERIAAVERAPRYPTEPILSTRAFEDLQRICQPGAP